jgi:hypothetical protein
VALGAITGRSPLHHQYDSVFFSVQHLLVHKFFWIYPHSQQQESWIIPFIIVMTWGRHCRVSRIPWGVHDEELDNGRKKVALGAITGRECVMPTQEWLTIWYYLFLAGQMDLNNSLVSLRAWCKIK